MSGRLISGDGRSHGRRCNQVRAAPSGRGEDGVKRSVITADVGAGSRRHRRRPALTPGPDPGRTPVPGQVSGYHSALSHAVQK